MTEVSNPVVLVQSPGRQTMRVVVTEPLDVGRECDGLIIRDTAVSRRHLTLDLGPEPGSVTVTDLDSSNGTYFENERLTSPVTVEPGNYVSLGDCTLTIIDPIAMATGGSQDFTRTVIDRGDSATSIDRIAESVSQSGGGAIDASGATRDSSTLTIVFSDIENSTARSSEMGDAKWVEILNHHTTLVEGHVKANKGRIIKNQGDGFMMTFPSARQAVLASIGIQRELDADPQVRVRIGMHTGEGLMDRQGDIFGHHVNKAARVSSLAEGAQIVVSDIVKNITASRGDLVFGEPVQAVLKGITDPAIVHELNWQESAV